MVKTECCPTKGSAAVSLFGAAALTGDSVSAAGPDGSGTTFTRISRFAALRRKPCWPHLRLIGLVMAYSLVLVGCRWLAYQLRFDFAVPSTTRTQMDRHWLWVIGLQLSFLGIFREFSGVTRYFGLPEIKHQAMALTCSATVLYLIRFFYDGFFSPPRGVILLDCLLALGMLAVIRLSYQRLHEGHWSLLGRSPRAVERVAIAGAGDVGANLVVEMNRRPALGLRPEIFLDDDRLKWNSYLHGVLVAGSTDSLKALTQKYGITKLIIAMPSARARRVAEVVRMAGECGLSCVTVPAIDQLTSGRMSVTQLRPVSIEDLLGREPVRLETEAIRKTVENQVVMVTGAGGSIGSEICRQVAACGPRRLLLVEHCEVQLFQIEQELIKGGYSGIILPLVANILDAPRMKGLFDEHRPSVVLHAAAHKHVPMMERQPSEAFVNNSLGTAGLAELALEFGVSRFLMISTDKAVNPTNAMGASKRLAEIYLQALFARNPRRTKFICVRFGNVLGSSGSVVPTFSRQIAAGGPVTVTHPDMVRYFMTIPEAVGLVLQSCAQGDGGEIFVLDMGLPVKIATLARQMIALSGLKPEVDIAIEYVGLRPGEKLFEELQCHDENIRPTRHPRIMSFVQAPQSITTVRESFATLQADVRQLSPEAVKERIAQLVPEYVPFLGDSEIGNRALGKELRPARECAPLLDLSALIEARTGKGIDPETVVAA